MVSLYPAFSVLHVVCLASFLACLSTTTLLQASAQATLVSRPCPSPSLASQIFSPSHPHLCPSILLRVSLFLFEVLPLWAHRTKSHKTFFFFNLIIIRGNFRYLAYVVNFKIWTRKVAWFDNLDSTLHLEIMDYGLNLRFSSPLPLGRTKYWGFYSSVMAVFLPPVTFRVWSLLSPFGSKRCRGGIRGKRWLSKGIAQIQISDPWYYWDSSNIYWHLHWVNTSLAYSLLMQASVRARFAFSLCSLCR